MFLADRGSAASILAGSLILSLFLVSPIQAQQFGTKQVISENIDAGGGAVVGAADLDDDYDTDVVVAPSVSGKIIWFENDGSGSFESQHLITSEADLASSLHLADLDSDGDIDVLSGSESSFGNGVAWYENTGSGEFGSGQAIEDEVVSYSVHAADLDSDGDLDVLSGIGGGLDRYIVWYENNGSGDFEERKNISDDRVEAYSVHAVDLTGSGEVDVLSAYNPRDSLQKEKIAWFENDDENGFDSQQVVAKFDSSGAFKRDLEVYPSDPDEDGDQDVIYALSSDQGNVLWYENEGDGSFAGGEVIADSIVATTVHAEDLDSDNDDDVLFTSPSSIQWSENQGGGEFGEPVPVSTELGALTAYATDLDTDGDNDVLATFLTGTGFPDAGLVWYENQGSGVLAPVDLSATPGDGQVDLAWNAGGQSSPAGYNVYRSTSSFSDVSDAMKINDSLVSDTDFTDTEVTNGTEYFYRVTAVDAEGNESDPSGLDTAVPGTPTTPHILKAMAQIFETEVENQTSGSPSSSSSPPSLNEFTFDHLQDEYEDDVKHLAFFQVQWPLLTELSASIYIDLDDYVSITEEGENSKVTYWIDVGFGLGVSLLPTNLGLTEVSIENTPPDPNRTYDFSGANISVAGVEINSFQKSSNGELNFTEASWDGSEINASASLGETSWNLHRGEIEREALNDLMLQAVNEVGTTFSGLPGIPLLGPIFEKPERAIAPRFNPTETVSEDDFREFTPLDDGTKPEISGTIDFGRGGIDSDEDGVLDNKYPFLEPPYNYFAGWKFYMKWTAGGLQDTDYKIEALNVPDGWSAKAIDDDGFAPIVDGELNFSNVQPETETIAKWAINRTTPSDDPVDLRFVLYEDNFFSDKPLDTLAVELSGHEGEVLAVNGRSPIDVEVTTPSGRTVTKSNFNRKTENYVRIDVDESGDPDSQLLIANQEDGSYQADVIPADTANPDDTYTLEVATQDGAVDTLAENQSVEDIPEEGYEYEYLPTPAVSTVEPRAGVPGTTVRLFGARFDPSPGANDVTFGEAEAEVTSAADKILTVDVPETAAPGPVPISVTVGEKTAAASRLFDVLATGQGGSFSDQQAIASDVERAFSVRAGDLDGDSDIDVVGGSIGKIFWYENEEEGGLSDQKVITTEVKSGRSVRLADLDGDGDPDLLSAEDNSIFWLENKGGGTFSSQKVITTNVDFVQSLVAHDLDGDGSQDIVSASNDDDKIAWYENQDGKGFSDQKVITTNAGNARSAYVRDLDGDRDADVLSASSSDDKIAWYENLGGGSFSEQRVITASAKDAFSVHAQDLDLDGDADVLSASASGEIAWYENEGGQTFSDQKTISSTPASSVFARDLDGDGDADVLSASASGEVAWYENEGGETFSEQRVITTNAGPARSVYARDLDGDGDADALSASVDYSSFGGDKIIRYENQDRQQQITVSITRTFGEASGPSDYRLVALPGSVDRSLGTTVSGESGVEWQAYWDDGSSQDYFKKYDGSDTFAFRPGRGFWLTSTQEWTFEETLPVVELGSGNATKIPLHDGWNIVSNPLEEDVSWEEIETANGGALQPAWTFEGGFSQADTFQTAATGQAYYFLNDEGLDSLIVPFPGTSGTTDAALASGTGRPEESSSTGEMNLLASVGDSLRSAVQVGVAGEDSEDSDAENVAAPPVRFSKLSLRLEAPGDAPARQQLLATEYRSPSAETEGGHTFNLRLKNKTGAPVRLEASGLEAFGGREVVLLNQVTGRSYDLRDQESVTVAKADSTALRLAVGSAAYVKEQAEKVVPDEVTLTSYPNPTAGQATLEYTLPEAGEVRLTVYDVLGRRVAVLEQGRKKAGRHRARLDGSQLPSGVYFGRLRVGDKAHSQKITVVR